MLFVLLFNPTLLMLYLRVEETLDQALGILRIYHIVSRLGS